MAPTSSPERRPSSSASARKPENRFGRDQQDAIGTLLRDFYDRVAGEPLPDEFRTLLSRLDEKAAAYGR